MDYLIGSLVSLLTVFLVLFILRRIARKNKIQSVQHSQSYLYELIRPILGEIDYLVEELETQATIHYDSLHTTVLSFKNNAYWIKDNSLYVADILADGDIDKENAKQVDTMSMNKVQLDEVMMIVEELTRGKGYDSRGTGK